jgi:hypothetical protein
MAAMEILDRVDEPAGLGRLVDAAAALRGTCVLVEMRHWKDPPPRVRDLGG